MEHGIIYHKNFKRGMFVVMLNDHNFIVFESYEINAFDIGNILYGNFNEYGSVTITNSSTLKKHLVTIHYVGLNAAIAVQKAEMGSIEL